MNRPPWRATPSGREPWHLSTGVVVQGLADRRVPQIVARSLCRFLRVAYGGLPAADRHRHLAVQLAAWAPFPEPGYALIEGARGCAVFAWDERALADRAHDAGLPWPPPRTWPETLFLAPPDAAGPDAASSEAASPEALLRLVPCREGCEAQVWQEGELITSRWWPQWPDEDAWQNFQRGAGVPEMARIGLPQASAWPGVAALGRPWAVPTSPQALRERQQLPLHAMAAVGLLALLLPTLWLAADLWRTQDTIRALTSQVRQLEADAQPVLRTRADTLAGLAALDALGSAFEGSDPLSLLMHLSQRLDAAGGAVVRELDWNGTRLRLVLAVPAARPRVAYVQALEDGGWLRNVREDTQDIEPGTLALVAELAARLPDGGSRTPQ